MKAKTIATAAASFFATVTPVLAATGLRVDNSGLVVWAFLGLCALIVLAQLMPAIFLLFGMVRGIVQGEKKEVEVSAE